MRKPLNLVYTYMMEKAMAIHSSILALEIPGTEEPGGIAEFEMTKNNEQASMHTYMNL